MSASEASAIYSAVSGGALASQSGAKRLLTSVLKGGAVGILSTLAISYGLDYINGQFQHVQTGDIYACQVGNQLYTGGGSKSAACSSIASSFGLVGVYSDPWCNFQTPQGQGLGSCQLGLHSTETTRQPIDEPQAQAIAQAGRDLSDAELEEMVKLGYAVPIVAPPATVIGDFENLTPTELDRKSVV
jgi:hypothetical protein